MADLKNLNLRTVPVDLGGVTLNVKRKPVTFDDWQAIAERQKEYQASEGTSSPDTYPLVLNIVQVVADLDITDNGKPVPVTAATLTALDVRVLVAIHDAVLEDANPNQKKP